MRGWAVKFQESGSFTGRETPRLMKHALARVRVRVIDIPTTGRHTYLNG